MIAKASLYQLFIWPSVNTGYNILRSVFALTSLLVFILNFNTIHDIVSEGQNPFKLQFLRFDIFSVFNFYVAYFLSVLILIASFLGYFPAITGLLHFYVSASYILRCPNMSDGGDYIAVMITFLLIPISITDKRVNAWQPYESTPFYENFQKKSVYVNYRALRLLFSIIYFHAAVSKFHVAEWYNGTALYYYINDPLSGNADLIESNFFKNILGNSLCITALGWGTLLTETLIAFMLFCTDRKIRMWIFFLGCLLHICIIPLFYIPMFSVRMITCLFFYLIVFPKEEEIV